MFRGALGGVGRSVVNHVIKHKIAKFAAINAKGLQDFSYSVSYRLTSVDTY